jgi:hypothetical protein
MEIYLEQFNRFPYYEHLQTNYLLDTMHIEKNVKKTLWRIVDRSDKEKNVRICIDSQEVNHAFQNVIYSNRNGVQRNSIPWLFTE